MELVLLVGTKDYQKVREILLRDDAVSRASIIFKEAKSYGKEGFYAYISGLEEQCKRALELIINKNTGEVIAKEVIGKEKEDLINKMKEEENRANEGFGSILG
ncbi:MAG: hypothetical protein QMD12_03285 [Candidatus Aenigmarchaeota archaeon]|nr:hypothetical protein [Candidatus Aenigmarchaeota archaeon]